jgi:hypothetical protein
MNSQDAKKVSEKSSKAGEKTIIWQHFSEAQRAAVASRRATNLANHLPNLATHLPLLLLNCKKRLAIFPSPAGMSQTKLSLSGNNLRRVWLVTSRLGTEKSLIFFYSVGITCARSFLLLLLPFV